MSVELIVILVAAAIFVAVAVLHRGGTLDKLGPLPGETVRFEETGVRVEQRGGPRGVLFFGCLVRVTDRRLIIAQKVLLTKKFKLRFVLDLDAPGDGADLGKTLGRGFVIGTLARDRIEIDPSGDKPLARFPLGGSALTSGQHVVVFTGRPGDFQKALA